MENKQIEAVREILRKYFNEDPLKPQYDGMTMWELSKKIVETVKFFSNETDEG